MRGRLMTLGVVLLMVLLVLGFLFVLLPGYVPSLLNARGADFKVGVIYVWHYPDDYDAEWRANLKPRLDRLMFNLQRLTNFTWRYDYLYPFKCDAEVGRGSPLVPSDARRVMRDLAIMERYFEQDYYRYDLLIVLFAGAGGALETNSSPIYLGVACLQDDFLAVRSVLSCFQISRVDVGDVFTRDVMHLAEYHRAQMGKGTWRRLGLEEVLA